MGWISRLFGGRRPSEPIVLDPLEGIAYLVSAGYPESVIRRYRSGELEKFAEINGVRMHPAGCLQEENEDATPGYVIAPLGYLNVASTVTGDAFCVDLNVRNESGEPRVVLASHDEIYEDSPPDEIPTKMVKVTDSFDEFIARFNAETLPSGYYDAKGAGYKA